MSFFGNIWNAISNATSTAASNISSSIDNSINETSTNIANYIDPAGNYKTNAEQIANFASEKKERATTRANRAARENISVVQMSDLVGADGTSGVNEPNLFVDATVLEKNKFNKLEVSRILKMLQVQRVAPAFVFQLDRIYEDLEFIDFDPTVVGVSVQEVEALNDLQTNKGGKARPEMQDSFIQDDDYSELYKSSYHGGVAPADSGASSYNTYAYETPSAQQVDYLNTQFKDLFSSSTKDKHTRDAAERIIIDHYADRFENLVLAKVKGDPNFALLTSSEKEKVILSLMAAREGVFIYKTFDIESSDKYASNFLFPDWTQGSSALIKSESFGELTITTGKEFFEIFLAIFNLIGSAITSIIGWDYNTYHPTRFSEAYVDIKNYNNKQFSANVMGAWSTKYPKGMAPAEPGDEFEAFKTTGNAAMSKTSNINNVVPYGSFRETMKGRFDRVFNPRPAVFSKLFSLLIVIVYMVILVLFVTAALYGGLKEGFAEMFYQSQINPTVLTILPTPPAVYPQSSKLPLDPKMTPNPTMLRETPEVLEWMPPAVDIKVPLPKFEATTEDAMYELQKTLM